MNGAYLHPRILRPVPTGGRTVWVTGVPVGATVTIAEGTVTTGEALAAEPVLPVQVRPVAGRVQATARFEGEAVTSDEVWPLLDPSEVGPYPAAAERDVDYGSFTVPTHATPEGQDGGYRAPLRGRVYLPANPGGDIPDRVRNVPLVVVAHGMWEDPERDLESHLGYAWLGEHLARWGMVACSIDLSEANRETNWEGLQQSARAEIILMMIECLLGDGFLSPLVSGAHVGLVGHSMGGEAVVVAQDLNQRRRAPYGIRAVVSLAPTNYRPEVASVNTAYLLLHGSADYLLRGGRVLGDNTTFNGFRLYDRAWRPRSQAWIDGARHQPWNTVWFDDPSFPDPGPEDGQVLDPERQRAIGRGLITACFADVLLGRSDYRGYLSGPATPQGFGDAVVQRQHQAATVELVDDFGDASEQLLLDAEDPRDKTTNRRGRPVIADGEGLDHWEDLDHQALPHSVHATHGTDVAWRSLDFGYRTGLDRLEVDHTGWLSLRVAQHYAEIDGEPDETWNGFGADLDLLVELDDGRHRAGVRLGAVDLVPYPLLQGWEVYIVFRTVRLPLDAFLAVEPDLDLGDLRQVRMRPWAPIQAPAGRVLIDDLEFETTKLTGWSTVAMLRAHELGTGYGPRTDFLDTEVVVQLTERPRETFGLQLRTGDERPAARRMLATLRTAMATRNAVMLGYRWSGPTVRELVRVITRP